MSMYIKYPLFSGVLSSQSPSFLSS